MLIQTVDILPSSTPENTNYSIDTIMAWYRGFKEDCPDGRLTPQVRESFPGQ